MTRPLALAVRLLSAFALLLTATYYLLGSIPFAYYQFLQSPPWQWMPVFVRIHPLLVLAAVAGLIATLRPLDARQHRHARLLLIVAVTVSGAMAAAFWVPGLESYELSGALCFAPLVLLAAASWLGLIGASRPPATPPVSAMGGAAAAAAIAGLAASLPFVANTVLLTPAPVMLAPRELAGGVVLAVIAHAALFAVIAVACGAVARRGVRGRWTRGAVLTGIGAVTAGVVAILMRSALLSALMFDDRRAVAVAIALGIALTMFWLAFLARPESGPASPGTLIKRRRRTVCDSTAATATGTTKTLRHETKEQLFLVRLRAFVSSWSRQGRRPWIDVLAYAAAAAACVFVVPPMVRLADWGQTLQKLLVMITWVSAATWIPDALRRGSGLAGEARRRMVIAAAVLVALPAALVATGLTMRGPRSTAPARDRVDAALAIDRYASFDLSLRVMLDVVRPALSGRAFLNVIREAGDVTDNRRLPEQPLRMVDAMRTAAYRPHIFIVVVDSLRPDYLSAYNPAAAFTPAIDAFARESIVMRRAFTPYAGTALSEPALWAGGLIPRAMYLKPFSAVNNLERLLTSGGYRRYISVDEVLGQILDLDGVVRLDSQIVHPERENEAYTLDLCGTVDELDARLATDPRDRPLFFYSQPKNLHIRVVAPGANRQDQMAPPPGEFFAPVVTAIRRLDGCFGRLIANLKRRGLYDDSIVVLTSDHGDAYGEEGRWGHAFYVSPETLRIPIVMHVPARLQESRHWDANAVAWLTDVTPSLFELSGQGPLRRDALIGRSWFAEKNEPLAPAPALQLVQSSYSRIFGLVDGDGRWLFTVDANRGGEALFDLTARTPVRQTLIAADQIKYEQSLKAALSTLNKHYAP